MQQPTKSDPDPRLATRNAILQAAIEILHANGAGALTVRSVANAAGCSTTGVYTWFGGKNGLVEAIFVDGFQRFGAALEEVRASAPNGTIDELAHVYRDWALANPTHYMVMFGRGVPDFQPGPDALRTALAAFAQLVDSTTRLMARRGINGDPNDIAHHLWAGMHGYVSLELAHMDRSTDDTERRQRFDDGVRRLVLGCLERPKQSDRVSV